MIRFPTSPQKEQEAGLYIEKQVILEVEKPIDFVAPN